MQKYKKKGIVGISVWQFGEKGCYINMRRIKIFTILYFVVVCAVIIQAAVFWVSSALDSRKPVKERCFFRRFHDRIAF